MAKHIELGKRGEQLAVKYLRDQGCKILETNWRFSRAEVDIIAMDQDILVFVEVKTRSNDYMGRPSGFVTHQKEKFLADAATVYMLQINHGWEIRFDIIGIVIRNEKTVEIEHFKDAFFPGW